MSITATTASPIQTIDWTFGWARGWGDAKSYLNQRIFGTLVQLAQPVMVEFQGDLFHDATWLASRETAPSEFYFAVRPSGTHLNTELGNMSGVRAACPEALVYRCTLAEGDGHWTFTAILTP